MPLVYPRGYALRVELPVDGSKVQGKIFPFNKRRVFFRKPYGNPAWHSKTNSPIPFSDIVVKHLVKVGVQDIVIDVPVGDFRRKRFQTNLATLLQYGEREYVEPKQLTNWNLSFEFYEPAKPLFVPFLPDEAVVNLSEAA